MKGSAQGPFKTPSKRLQEPFENPSRRCRNRRCVRLPGAFKFLSQKSCRTKVPRIFRIFVPNFAPNFAPEFSPEFFEEFSCFVSWETETRKKFTKNPRLFSMQNSQANTKKIFTKCFWRAGTVINSVPGSGGPVAGNESLETKPKLINYRDKIPCPI